jgi:UDP:flavonoid glycosyltransferase YjiC (YdhE family)
MRVLAACSLGGAGHLQPLVPFLDAARRRGDETLVVGPPALREMVADVGHPFRPGGEPPEDAVAPLRERLPVAPPEETLVIAARDLFGRLATAAMLPGMTRACAEWGPDLVLREPCEYASSVVAGDRGLAIAQVAISVAQGEAASIDAAAPALEEQCTGLTDQLRDWPYLTRFPGSLDPSPFPATVRFRPNPVADPDPLPDWWPGNDAPLVYVTFGTVLGYMSIAAGVYRTALQAMAEVEARVLLTMGRQVDVATLGPLPEHVHLEKWVDQDRVLHRADVVVCHGGSGTTFGALAAGVPLVVVPVFADQFENARRVAAAGAGRMVESGPGGPDGRRRPVTEDGSAHITAAVDEVLGDERYRWRARAIAEEMAGAPTVDDVLAQLLDGRR